MSSPADKARAILARPGAQLVLIDDARREGSRGAKLFYDPERVIRADSVEAVEPALAAMRSALLEGRYLAGWMAYEAGAAFEPRLARRPRKPRGQEPLLWFGVFGAPVLLSAAELAVVLPDKAGAWLSPPAPRISQAAYDAAFDEVQRLIRQGDVYQINLSYRADLNILGHPLAAYAQLRDAGEGGWSGVVHDAQRWLLSTSPELFFALQDGKVEARPMKGTARRGATPAEDQAIMNALEQDPKQRAENVMIVDLLRNDLSRIARRGSVSTPVLFSVETFPTLHAMTSTVRADLADGADVIDVVRALFPCGSVTGAPKIRAMEIIDMLESDARGPYTGAIGWIAPDGCAEFNVAIRTLVVSNGEAEIGLGSGVVADSTARDEWSECSAKGEFLTAAREPLELFETMRCDPGIGIANLDLHLARLARSAAALGFGLDLPGIRQALARAALDVTGRCALKLILSVNGAFRIECREAPPLPAGPVNVAVAPLPVAASDFRLRHKTTSRAFYDTARERADAFEVVFADADGYLTEGSFTNVFLAHGSQFMTPPLHRGLLPGILRERMVQEGRAFEGDMRVADLEHGFFVGNALRGLIAANVVKR